ncbi:TPA: helix-turn-helix transcriptional regulator [Yersinia enterocolitica]|uniref:XRE family transcriptional regulator n=1 Tax=Yersinia enterocolitica TaxID=630 RepID=UPI0032FB5A84|nr:helix-turn-helix transcriptional regulator [Yersinia enterocolitica]HDL6972956.1 helix-turn-helix transcriptional regulator [Yersinia enterocolitica]HDL6976055.1 helix-turn-helix transcriptional regulator [Yersinia enterocolitica]HDL6989536.1 helix-turn-helix transcriptional regulator [Yersinia enterocolitica]HDL6998209.1 helix-turn-helix transcriptional regulator [Yersinia enterocolitica]
MSLAERVKERREAIGITQTELADKVGIKQQSIASIENGETKNPRKIFELAQALKCSVHWLKTGNQESNATQLEGISLWEEESEDEEDDVYLPFFKEAQLAAGDGRVVELDCEGKKLKFSLRSLKKLGVKPEEAACMSVWGNSMEPVLPDGATVAINTGNTEIKDGKIYALDHDGMARVKIMYRLPGGGIRLRSFNTDEFPDEIYTGEDSNKIRVVGAVFWYGVTIR